jgi:hypothetical protein
MTSSKDEKFSPEETKGRLEAALRGAREVGHKEMKDIGPKRAAVPRKRAKKTAPA